ncbi:MAG: phage baseplate assembly protein V [Magnetovibrionaceae bacterium]
MNDLARLISKLISPLQRSVDLMIGRCIIAAVNDGAQMQTVQAKGLHDETLTNREHFQDYGFTANPHIGAEALILSLGGNRNHTVIIQVDDRRYRLKGLAQGEVALYDDKGQVVHLTRNGIVMDSPDNIIIRTDGILRLEGQGVEIHGREYVQTDVHGKGQRETHTGANAYHVDSYQFGAVTSSVEKSLDQPDIPSDHPLGPGGA